MTLTRRLIGMAALVAVISVGFTGVTMLGLFKQGAAGAAALGLQREASTVAATLEALPARRPVRAQEKTDALVRRLNRRQIELAVARSGDAVTNLVDPFTQDDVAATQRDGTLSDRRTSGGVAWLVEGTQDGGTTVLLAQPLDRAISDTGRGRGRLLLSLLVGLVAGGVAGLVLARQLGGPLHRLASGARQLSAGRRDVQLRPEGPAELADVASALNDLNTALATSETRQRRFLMDVSHELRTPLTAVSGYAEGLADGVITADEVPRAATVIRDEAARLGRRIEDLMALARMEADDFRVELAATDLGQLVRAAGQAWAPRAAAAGVMLRLGATAGVLASTDGERLRQAVDALLDNALRVLPSGSTIRLGCGLHKGQCWLEVSDDGPGLAEEDLAVAFERGRLTDRYRGERPVGTGLGLALVGELVSRLGGQARAGRSAAGGAAFVLFLPVAQVPAGPAGQAGPNPNTLRTLG
jgi:two-component system sensor histidine kinase BaeS